MPFYFVFSVLVDVLQIAVVADVLLMPIRKRRTEEKKEHFRKARIFEIVQNKMMEYAAVENSGVDTKHVTPWIKTLLGHSFQATAVRGLQSVPTNIIHIFCLSLQSIKEKLSSVVQTGS